MNDHEGNVLKNCICLHVRAEFATNIKSWILLERVRVRPFDMSCDLFPGLCLRVAEGGGSKSDDRAISVGVNIHWMVSVATLTDHATL